MNIRVSSVVIGLGTGLVCSAASAQVTLVSQERWVQTNASTQNEPPFLPPGGSSDADGMQSPDFAPFSAAVTSQAGQASAQASQDSTLLADRIRGTGEARASLAIPLHHIIAMARGRTYMRIGFSVGTTLFYELSGGATLDAQVEFYSGSTIQMRVTGPGSATVYQGSMSSGLDPDLAVDQRGRLAPGQYEFLVSVDAFLTNANNQLTATDHATFELDLKVRCPADFNGEGGVNSQDFFDFLAAFFAQDIAADYTGDGTVNSQDFFDFLGFFFSGC